MGVTALVMAGGKGTRMASSEEKPLLRVGGKPVIEHVLAALGNARKIDSIVVAVSDYTPKTEKLMTGFPVTVVKTPGREYVFDLGYAVKALKLQTVMAVAADLPLITGEIVDAIIERYERCGKPALAVVVPMETKEKLGLAGDYSFVMANRRMVPAGINVIDGRRIDEKELDQEVFLLDLEEVAVNINTVQELEIAEKLFAKMSRK
ncbi:MAG: NTP transferase domain-containing protein [Candidatus Bathyarchaeota archaeon]|nr:NTP transferase domain-containing protein [Candidatus Bathyarchaeota archaeon]